MFAQGTRIVRANWLNPLRDAAIPGAFTDVQMALALLSQVARKD
jgi:hypothetical protein